MATAQTFSDMLNDYFGDNLIKEILRPNRFLDLLKTEQPWSGVDWVVPISIRPWGSQTWGWETWNT